MVKYRTEEVVIDIGKRSVKVVKTNTVGKIVKAGFAHLPDDMPDVYDPMYTARLAAVIKKAGAMAGAGKLNRTALVMGGPHVIIRRFLWPEMPHTALYENAQTEMAPYLPGDGETYTVGYRTLRKVTPDSEADMAAPQLDIMATAIPKSVVEAYLSACRKAGFNPKRIDVRENAREKLVQDVSLWTGGGETFDLTQSFAFLDVSEPPYNLTVFINGVFYVNRYFGGEGDDAGAVSAEIASILDYIQYRERGAKVSGLLLLGGADTVRELKESLARDLGIPTVNISDCLNLSLPPLTDGPDISGFLDAYGAAIKVHGDVDLKPRKEGKDIGRRFVLPAACTAAAVAVLIAAGVYFPQLRINDLRTHLDVLDKQLERFGVVSVQEAALLVDVYTFRTASPYASESLGIIDSALPSDTEIRQVSVEGKEVSLLAQTDDLDKVAVMLENLRGNALVKDAGARIESVTYPGGMPVVVFNMTLELGVGTEDSNE
jgi:Tfp pilus assembly PilM family ATPase